ncbi:hypothetical protein [Methyloceanibacter sp.]|uniref:hypothetical protein n=1 Tax=Methyloceanibacter sp. TaxID=1965321 RepID=UPI002D1FB0CF|nr:hypothetical protein [Methyloceanibacter sp.]
MDTADAQVVAEAAAGAVSDVASPAALIPGDALQLLLGDSQSSDSDSEELCGVAKVVCGWDRRLLLAPENKPAWRPHQAGAPPVPPPERRAAIVWTPFQATLLDLETLTPGDVGGPDGESPLKPATKASATPFSLPCAQSIRSAAARDAQRLKSPPAKHPLLSRPDILSWQLAHALACAPERHRRFVRIENFLSMKSLPWRAS